MFYIVHEILANSATDNHLTVRLEPKFIEPIQQWIVEKLEQPGVVPSPDEVNYMLSIPLLEQIKIDAGEGIYELSAGRLGIDGPPQSVRQQSKRMEVTRRGFINCSKIAAR